MTRQYVGLRISSDAEAVPTTADMGEGELAINVASGRIYVRFGVDIRDITDRYTRDEIDQMLGSAAALDAPESGNAGSAQVVLGSDTRLSDARAPTFHNHPWSQITDKPGQYPPEQHGHTLSEITDAGTAASADRSDFDASGSAAAAEYRLRETLRERPDPLLMHFL